MPSSLVKVLVVDDEAAILRLVSSLLGRFHYEVATAESAREAMAMLEQRTFDCVITDAVMPELDGYELVRTLRANSRFAALPILMLTRKRHRQDVKKAVESGVTDYVLKPIDEALLIEKLELCLRKGGSRPAARERQITGELSLAEIGVGCLITSLGEATLTLRLQYRLEQDTAFQLRGRIFDEIGIEPPAMRLESCEMKPADEPSESGSAAFGWEARVSYAQLPEGDARKIRDWMRRSG